MESLSKYFKKFDYTEEFRKEQSLYIESLSKEQKEAIIEYTKNTNINNYLLGDSHIDYSKEVKFIDTAFNEAPPLKFTTC